MRSKPLPIALTLLVVLAVAAIFFFDILGNDEEPPTQRAEPEPPLPDWAQGIPKRPDTWTVADVEVPNMNLRPTVGKTITENLTLNEDLVFAAPCPDLLISIEADDITLDCRGYKIQGAGKVGLLVRDKKNLRLLNCNVEGPFLGILAENVEGLKMEGGGLKVQTLGAHLTKVKQLSITEVTFAPLQDLAVGYALEVHQSADVSITRNHLTGFDQGLLIYSTKGIDVSENQIERIVETGIGLFQSQSKIGCGDGEIKNNRIHLCMMGLEIHAGSHNVLVTKNEVTRCLMALRMDDDHSTPRFNAVVDVEFRDNRFHMNLEDRSLNLGEESRLIGIEKGPPGDPLL